MASRWTHAHTLNRVRIPCKHSVHVCGQTCLPQTRSRISRLARFIRVYGCRCLYTISTPLAANARVYFIICRIGYEILFWQIPAQCVGTMGGIIFDVSSLNILDLCRHCRRLRQHLTYGFFSFVSFFSICSYFVFIYLVCELVWCEYVCAVRVVFHFYIIPSIIARYKIIL